MPHCRTKQGTLRIVYEGTEILLDANGAELPAGLAANIQGHKNVVVGGERAAATEPAPRARRGKRGDEGEESEESG